MLIPTPLAERGASRSSQAGAAELGSAGAGGSQPGPSAAEHRARGRGRAGPGQGRAGSRAGPGPGLPAACAAPPRLPPPWPRYLRPLMPALLRELPRPRRGQGQGKRRGSEGKGEGKGAGTAARHRPGPRPGCFSAPAASLSPVRTPQDGRSAEIRHMEAQPGLPSIRPSLVGKGAVGPGSGARSPPRVALCRSPSAGGEDAL